MTMLFQEATTTHQAVPDPPTGIGTGGLTFEYTIPRHLVHRAAVSEVLLTDLHEADEHTFHVGAQWPRDHGYYRLRGDDHDPVLLAESIRQAALLIAHRVFEVPLDRHFLTRHQSFRVLPEALALGSRPADILLVVSCRDVVGAPRRVRGMRMEIDCYRDRTWIGSGEVSWSCTGPAAYARLRGDRCGAAPAACGELPVPVRPGSVGRDRDRDVAIGMGTEPGSWPLRVNPAHAVLFDHPVDHVPGMVLLEAARQAALLVLGDPDAVPSAVSIDFERYVEHEPATVSAAPLPSARSGVRGVSFSIDQEGRQMAAGELEMVLRG